MILFKGLDRLLENINTKNYWDQRFGSGDWEKKGGYSQTKLFAQSQIPMFHMKKEFNGTICDFGCGAGDAFPLYRENYPNATLIGVDFSDTAIELCRAKFNSIAKFVTGDVSTVPEVDVLIASNVLEHLENDKEIAKQLLERCNHLYIIVPFREALYQGVESEHINSYDLNSFDFLGKVDKQVFKSKGWGPPSGLSSLYHIDLKNIVRFLLGGKISKRYKQIMYLIQK